MNNVVNFTPKQISNEEFMRRYQAECALAGTRVSPEKCESGDNGTITKADGDVLYVGDEPV